MAPEQPTSSTRTALVTGAGSGIDRAIKRGELGEARADYDGLVADVDHAAETSSDLRTEIEVVGD